MNRRKWKGGGAPRTKEESHTHNNEWHGSQEERGRVRHDHHHHHRSAEPYEQVCRGDPPIRCLEVEKVEVPCRLLVCATVHAVHTGSVALVSGDSHCRDDHGCDKSDDRKEEEHQKKKRRKKRSSGVTRVVTLTRLPQSCPYVLARPQQRAVVVCVRPLLVLDLNGILCHRIRDRDVPPSIRAALSPSMNVQSFYRPTTILGVVAGTPIVPRTDLHSFLSFLDQHFTLAVWTSAQTRTANTLVSMLFPSHVSRRLLFVWAQNKCQVQQRPTIDDKEQRPSSSSRSYCDTLFIKSLSKVWEAYPLWNASNTLLLDDSPDKCPNYENTIHPPPITGISSPLGEDMNDHDDDKNQRQQFAFFRQLVNYWPHHHHQHHTTHDDDDQEKDDDTTLLCFLKQYGRGHMGWRGE